MPCQHSVPVTSPVYVTLPNGTQIAATHSTVLDLPHVPLAARRAYIFPQLEQQALLSIGQLCNHGYTAHFTATTVVISKSGRPNIVGQRQPATGLWTIPVTATTPRTTTTVPVLVPVPVPVPLAFTPPTVAAAACNVYASTNKSDLVQFYHQSCCSPTVGTWTDAIDKGFFATWPGLTSELVRKHLPKSVATVKGHQRQQFKNVRSTKAHALHVSNSIDSTTAPAPTNWIFVDSMPVTGRVYTDQTGQFPYVSSRGNKYVMILYDYDSNAIMVAPMKSRTETELVRAYKSMFDQLVRRGLKPTLQKLDNEAPAGLKQFLQENEVGYQLVPPHVHRRNAAERAISTFKDHFIAGLASTDKDFPMHLWDRLLPQAQLTLNLMRQSRINPRLSAEAQLNGAFDFNATPLAPPGTKVLLHDKPNVRRSWDPHGTEGWYVGPAREHYRCYRVHCTKSGHERIGDTVEFFPTHCKLPFVSSAEAATRAAADLAHALANPAPPVPYAKFGDDQLAAIRALAQLFSRATAPPSTTIDTVAPVTPVTPAAPRVEPVPVPILAPPALRATVPEPAAVPRVPMTVPTGQPRAPAAHRHNTRYSTSQRANAVVDVATGQSQEYRHLVQGPDKAVWQTSFANEIGRLAQGVGTRMTSGTDTIFFIPRDKVPPSRKATYGRIVVSIRPQKTETHRTRLTVGGNLIDYPDDVSTPTADLTTAKILFNSVVSTPGAKFMTVDIKDFYLNTPMPRYEYMQLPLKTIPPEIIIQYKLDEIASNGTVYVEIRKGMYGLPQAGIIANQKLTRHLAKYGYHPTKHTPGLWQHDVRPVTFSLVVDDFGIKYVGKEHAEHLINALRADYRITVDWEGQLYCALALNWDYNERSVTLSMPGYIAAALHKFQHPTPPKPQHAPHAWTAPQYSSKTAQLAMPIDDSPPLPADQVQRIQQVVGTLLYYARAVDSTLLVALNTIASSQAKATEHTAAAVTHLLDYCATHPNAMIKYFASDMTLHIDSDASYLSVSLARSRAGGHFYLSEHSNDKSKAPTTVPTNNGAIHTVCTVIKNVVGSAAEAEFAALYYNGQEAAVLRTTLEEMGHTQPPTPMKTDNSTASGIVNNTIKQRRSRAMDMRYYWIRDRIQQEQLLVYWMPGATNLADYFTKHHSPAHHQEMKSTYLHIPDKRLSRGCVNTVAYSRKIQDKRFSKANQILLSTIAILTNTQPHKQTTNKLNNVATSCSSLIY